MANIDDAFSIEILSLNDTVLIAQGSPDPTIAAGYEAPTGSLYLRAAGELYQKFGPSNVDWTKLATDSILNNYTAVVGPTVNDDSGDGYSVGSHWIDTAADLSFICVDSTVGAAVWLNISTGIYLGTTGITGQNSGVVTVNAGNAALIDITSCTYFIQGLFYQYPGAVGVDPQFETLEDSVFIGLNATQNIVRKTTKWSATETRTIIPIARLNTAAGSLGPGSDVHLIRDDRYFIDEVGYRDRLWHERVIGALYQKGGLISENTTSGLQLDQSAGILFDAQKKEQILSAQQNIAALKLYHSAGVITAVPVAPLVVDTVNYDNGTNLVAIPSNKWVVHTLLKSPKGSPQEGEFFFVYGKTLYNTLVDAEEQGPDYDFFIDQATSGIVAIATIIVNEGDTNVISIRDLRPVIGASALSVVSGTTPTMQNAYDVSTNPQYSLDAIQGGIEIRDSVTPVGVDLFTITDSAATTNYLNVTAIGVSTSGNIIVDGTVDGRDVALDGTNQDNHIASTANPHSTSVDNLADVVITTPIDGHILAYNTGQWVNIPEPSSSLVQLDDTTITGPVADNEILAFDNISSRWINQTAAEASLVTTTVLSNHTTDGTIHFTEASIDHTAITNIGTNSHAAIDTHIAATNNPHSTTLANLTDTNFTSLLDNQFIKYDSATSKWINETVTIFPSPAQISATDTTPGYLGTEIVAGPGIQLNILNPGADEKLEIVNLSSAPNIWATINGTTGTTTANLPADTLTINGATGITTSITGDTLTIAPANDLGALEALASTGIAARTGTDTWAQRTVTGTTDQIVVTNGSGAAGNPLIALAANTVIPGTAGIDIPSGTTAERPVTPSIGHMRFNTSSGQYEAWNGTVWVSFGALPGSSVTEILSGQIPQLAGTTIIPSDDTPPLITEGTQFFSRNITTQTDGGRVVIWFSTIVTVSNSNRLLSLSLFRDSTLIGVMAASAPGSNSPQTVTFIIADAPGAAGTYAYSGRIGLSASATWYIGATPLANYGGAASTNHQYVLMRLE